MHIDIDVTTILPPKEGIFTKEDRKNNTMKIGMLLPTAVSSINFSGYSRNNVNEMRLDVLEKKLSNVIRKHFGQIERKRHRRLIEKSIKIIQNQQFQQ